MTKHIQAYSQLRKKYSKPENIIYIFAFTTPLFELPQLVSIIVAKSAQNVSLITWLYLAISSFAWLLYGIKKREKPLIVSYILYVLAEFSIVGAILWFH